MAILTIIRLLFSTSKLSFIVQQVMFAILVHLLIAKGGTSTPLSLNYASVVSHGDSSQNTDDSISPELFNYNSAAQQDWHVVTVLSVTKGMSARSDHNRNQQSFPGLDYADMDQRATELGARAGQEVSATSILSWLDWQLLLFVVLCALVGAILVTFVVLLWIRKQMSCEKDTDDGDRQGLVEEGAVCPPEKSGKELRDPVEAQWVCQPIMKPPIAIQPIGPDKGLSTLPEVVTLSAPERRPEPIRIKAKGLLERRGSSASLTIELAPASESPPRMVTPTRECTAEEFLLSAGNVLSRSQLCKVIGDPASLHKEFWDVPLNLPLKVDVCGSGIKNRYSSVLPNPQSRVVLPGSDDPLASYINANYIRGYDGEDARYIATQGPLSHTIVDFWRMVWAERVPAVVMMTRLHESTKIKCDPYFPLEKNGQMQFEAYTVSVLSVEIKDGYTLRELELRYENERRHVQHYWYDTWPDHAVPQAAGALVGLASEVNSLSGPVVVHCSAGIGRTGCFIALATGMIQLMRDGNVDVLGILCQMRYDRGGMVQTAEQYEFVHRALCLFEQSLGSITPSSGD